MSNDEGYAIHIIRDGYSFTQDDDVMRANSTCTLLKGTHNIIVDTMSPWDKDVIVNGLAHQGLSCDDIQYVVCTHGHIDHVGNLNLFTKAMQFVGSSVSKEDYYYPHPFDAGTPYKIDKFLEVIPTPGHTSDDVSVIVDTVQFGKVGVVGDLFERQEDIDDSELWCDVAGSRNPELQTENRRKVANLVDYIVPGHGPMFQVTQEMREKLDSQFENQ